MLSPTVSVSRSSPEYAFRQSKQELGWTDYRFTNFAEINKWWEIIYSTYLMISFNTPVFISLNSSPVPNFSLSSTNLDIISHPQWNHQPGWKNVFNNLRLMIYAKRYPLGQPTFIFWLIYPWLEIFPSSDLLIGFHRLIHTLNQPLPFYSSG
ncbi:MAG: hypothetical protein AAGF83_27735 [Cyanobacteria bacterium P01_G01_bin.67]